MKTTQEKVGDFIRLHRKAAGMSQAKLAELAGLGTAMNIARYESGSVRIPAENLSPIAKAVKCDLTELTRIALPLYGLNHLSKFIPSKRKRSGK